MTIILEEAKWIWSNEEVSIFRQMWEEDKSSMEIARALNCKILDVALLVMDQAEKKLIQPRSRGIK